MMLGETRHAIYPSIIFLPPPILREGIPLVVVELLLKRAETAGSCEHPVTGIHAENDPCKFAALDPASMPVPVLAISKRF